MYDGIKKAMGPTMKEVTAFKLLTGKTLTDRTEPMARWVEHCTGAPQVHGDTVVENEARSQLAAEKTA